MNKMLFLCKKNKVSKQFFSIYSQQIKKMNQIPLFKLSCLIVEIQGQSIATINYYKLL
jgi:hypothetical protein